MKKINPINLYLVEKKDKFFINIEKSEKFLSTPSGKVITNDNRDLIEIIIYELQKYIELEINEKNSIVGEPIEKVSIYGLISTQLDYWEDNSKTFPLEEMKRKIKIDPLTNLSPGPEQVDQIYQWREIVKFIENKNFNFHKLQYFGEEEQQSNLAKEILDDFNNAESFQKAIFIQLTHIFNSIISSWIFVFGELSANQFATIFTETASFQTSLDYAPIDEELDKEGKKLDGTFPIEMFGKGSNEDEVEDIKLKQKRKLELFREIEEISEICFKFKKVNEDFLGKLEKIINKGESKTLELKETFTLDVKKQTREKYLEYSVLKTIAGFLNSDGGMLLIGVRDDTTIIGIENEIQKLFKNKDKFLLHLSNKIKSSFGEKVFPLINSSFKKIKDKNILQIECRSSEKPIWMNEKEFFVRTDPATEKLEGPNLVEYIKTRFKE